MMCSLISCIAVSGWYNHYMLNQSSEILKLTFEQLDSREPLYRIVRDDLHEDSITKLRFDHYDDAYDELERFYGDTCCSDERIEYSIVLIWLVFLVSASSMLLIFTLAAPHHSRKCVWNHTSVCGSYDLCINQAFCWSLLSWCACFAFSSLYIM